MRQHIVFAAAAVGVVVVAAGNPLPNRAPTIDSLPSPAGAGSAEPNFAVTANGRVHLSWLEPAPDSAFALKVSSFDGKSWSAPSTIRTGRDFFVNWADFPSVRALDGRRLAAHWLQKVGKSTYAYHVRVAFSNDGGSTWGPATTPHTDTSGTEHGFVAMWAEGSTLGAAWLDGRQYNKEGHNPSNEMSVAATTFTPAGARGVETMLDTRACDCCQVDAAMTSAGPIVVYRDRSAEEIRDISITRRVNGTWTEPNVVHADNWRIAACPVNGPAVAANGRTAAVAWFTAANDSARVKFAWSTDAGATFGAPVRIDEGAPAGRVDVQLLNDGSALVSWIERVGGDTAVVRARRVASNGRAGAPITIARSSVARTSGFPRMAVTGNDVFFAWTQPTRPSQVRVARMSQSLIR